MTRPYQFKRLIPHPDELIGKWVALKPLDMAQEIIEVTFRKDAIFLWTLLASIKHGKHTLYPTKAAALQAMKGNDDE